MELIQNIDYNILEFLQSMHNAVLDNLFLFITRMGDSGIVWILISFGLMLFTKDQRKTGVLMLIALIVAMAFSEGILKVLFERPRPYIEYESLRALISPTSFSFPSGHTTSSFTAFFILNNKLKGINYKWAFLILALLISFSRMYLMVHYLTDILGGVVAGLIVAYVVILTEKQINKFIKQKKQLN